MRRSVVLFVALVGLALPAFVQAQEQPAQKIPVRTADDLPRHVYRIEGKATEFLLSDAPFRAFLREVRANAESDLRLYDITDPTTLQGYHTTLQQIAMLEGRWDDALAHVEKIRDLETKESKRLMTGQTLRAYVAADRAAGGEPAIFERAFRQELKRRVGALPWDQVQDDVKRTRGTASFITRDLIMGQLQGQLDPIVEQAKGEISGDLALGLIGARATLDVMLPLLPHVAEVYAAIIAEHESGAPAKRDIWSERQVTLREADGGKPVVVCIWDSGVDVAIFSNNVWVNPAETMNGRDDDGNGFIDDVHGIAFDLENRPAPELLFPLDGLRSDRKLITGHTKGLLDLQSNIESPEADALRRHITGLAADDVTPFIEDLGLFGNFSHGTHVAGIAAEGNPFVRILPIRISYDYRVIPQLAPSVELARREAEMYAASVAYMKKAGVRVVNMSWGGSRANIEQALEAKGVGRDAAERAELSREIFRIGRDGLESAIRSAPEILFIAAAGNSDNDNEFSEMIPSGLDLPNLITVGAVDQSGKPTGFTTFGRNVRLYANGFEVESYIPGGERLKFSGTSMAAPNVANLAAKLFALNPRLTPGTVIEMMARYADPMEGYEGRTVINPKETIAALRSRTPEK